MKKQEEVWNELADSWNKFRRNVFPGTIKDLDWKPGRILDLGCGNGRNLIGFSERGFDCYGVDFSTRMIDNAKEFFKGKKLKANFKVGSLVDIPFEDGYFDYVICVAAFHNLDKKDWVKCLDEIKRVLKDKGKLYISVWRKTDPERKVTWKIKDKVYERYYYFFEAEEFKDLLEKNDFKIRKIIIGRNIEVIAE